MARAKSTTTKTPKRPCWSLWKNKKTGHILYDVDDLINPSDEWDHVTRTRIAVPAEYTKEDFEELNPAEFTFVTTLQFTGITRGQSAVNFDFESLDNGDTFSMLTREFEKVFKNSYFHKGAIQGCWRFEKHGSSVGICLIKEIEGDGLEDESI